MKKQYYTAQIVFSSKLIRFREDFEQVILKPYRRNTQLVSFSTNYGYPDIRKTEVTLLITSKNSTKALRTLNLIVEEISCYSGFNCCIFEKKLNQTFQNKFWTDYFTGEIQVYVK